MWLQVMIGVLSAYALISVAKWALAKEQTADYLLQAGAAVVVLVALIYVAAA